MSEKELLLHVIKSFGVDVTAAEAELFSDGSLKEKSVDYINGLIKSRNEKIKNDFTDKFNAGHKAAKAEVLTAYEKSLKDKYQLDDELTGDDLISEIIKKQSKVDDATIVSHPSYKKIADELKLSKKKSTEYDKIKSDFDSLNEKFVSKSITQHAIAEFEKLNPLLSKDAAKAAQQKKDFVAVMRNYKFNLNDEEIKPMDKDGNILQDENGNEITFATLVKKEAESRFDFSQPQNNSSAGAPGFQRNNQSSGQHSFQNSGFKITKPKTEDEYYATKKQINDSDLKPEEKTSALRSLADLGIGS